MAADVCGENPSMVISPRTSFSYDLNGDGGNENNGSDESQQDFDFHFCFSDNHSSFFEEVSCADELFSGGRILPMKASQCPALSSATQEILPAVDKSPLHDGVPPRLGAGSYDQATTTKKLLKEFLAMSLDEVEKPPNLSKSFWRFKRSNSFNHDVYEKSKVILRSLSFLQRSNSTGSAPNPRRRSLSASEQAKVPQEQRFVSSYTAPTKKSPALRKCGSYGNGTSVRVSPVLNIVPPYLVGGVSLSGLSSLFCRGKVVRKRHD